MTVEWAKAPNFADQPERLAAVHAQTTVDKAEYLESGLADVQCGTCGACVLVRKNSPKHTSIEWQESPASRCPVFRERLEAGQPSAAQQGCPHLRASIDYAVAEGLVEVRDPSA
ncbi:hypothetical protein [Rhodococcus sp. HNM0569]|uniref:hypothetical protein n=1 Tax=Rhodococcus sp. HNM0569 TaxID=2716340 RepID=UPI00146F2B06|nr:hypothetical protein [Rhodococcus sp. HNM0569]NLU82179.1 hypothetical protein [Rhodococcus sp. HNM0569]